MVRISVRSTDLIRVLRRYQYLMVTLEGLKYAEKWNFSTQIPQENMKLYQLLLKMIWMGGKMTINHAIMLGYNEKFLAEARLNGYVKITRKQDKLPYNIQQKISDIIGEAPQQIYA